MQYFPWQFAIPLVWTLASLCWGGELAPLASQESTDERLSYDSVSTLPHASDLDSTLQSFWEELKIGGTFDLEVATGRVYVSTKHSDHRRICFTENWVQWLAGQVYAPLRRTQDTKLLVQGRRTDCGERCQILKTLAESAGKECRFVGLNGHVVLEVKDQGIWRMADPDYGIVFQCGVQELSRPIAAAHVREVLLGRGYSPARVDRYLGILQSTDDNVFLPSGQALSPRLWAIERGCYWLAWLLPIMCLAAGTLFCGTAWQRTDSLLRRFAMLKGNSFSRGFRANQPRTVSG